jgi:hypothetical protein
MDKEHLNSKVINRLCEISKRDSFCFEVVSIVGDKSLSFLSCFNGRTTVFVVKALGQNSTAREHQWLAEWALAGARVAVVVGWRGWLRFQSDLTSDQPWQGLRWWE